MARSASANSLPPPLGPSWMAFNFEENFDVSESIQFFNDYAHIPIIIVIGVYLPMIHFGQKIMANREPIKAKKFLVLWNFGLAVFSILGFLRLFPELFHTFRYYGYEHTICNDSIKRSRPVTFWIYLFVLSKIPELVDTLFLVLRKQKLIFLHVWHHATVPISGWLMYADQIAAARWFCTMNFGVHSIMYTYYALKAFPNELRVPKWVSMLITTLQILQMVVATYATASVAYIRFNGKPCLATTRTVIVSLTMYVSYLLLFAHFFYKAYFGTAPPRSVKDIKKRV